MHATGELLPAVRYDDEAVTRGADEDVAFRGRFGRHGGAVIVTMTRRWRRAASSPSSPSSWWRRVAGARVPDRTVMGCSQGKHRSRHELIMDQTCGLRGGPTALGPG